LTREQADGLIAALPPHLANMASFALAEPAAGERDRIPVGLGQSQPQGHVDPSGPGEGGARARSPVTLNADAIAVLRRREGEHPTRTFSRRSTLPSPHQDRMAIHWYKNGCNRT